MRLAGVFERFLRRDPISVFFAKPGAIFFFSGRRVDER